MVSMQGTVKKIKPFGKLSPKSKHRLMKAYTKWREDILLSFGYDPLKCPQCDHEMQFIALYYNHRRVSLEELYEREKAKCRSASFFLLSVPYLSY